jgi:hypothetical protein
MRQARSSMATPPGCHQNCGPMGDFTPPFLFGMLLRMLYERSCPLSGFLVVLTVVMAIVMSTMRFSGGALLLVVLSILRSKIAFFITLGPRHDAGTLHTEHA